MDHVQQKLLSGKLTFHHLYAVYLLGERKWTMFNRNCYMVSSLSVTFKLSIRKEKAIEPCSNETAMWKALFLLLLCFVSAERKTVN